jgi:hypothetical protein
MPNKALEIWEEFRTVVVRQNSFLDAILPPIVVLLLNGVIGFEVALWGALTVSVLIAALRLWKGKSVLYALAGVVSVGLALTIALVLGRSEGFFAADLISGSMTLLLALLSLAIRRPMIAWTSFIARRWPLSWYWHPQVRPAYSEVTFAWTTFFAARLYVQISLYQQANTSALAVVKLLTGWPATILLLILSYLYGTWRLAKLHGPSVEEFQNNSPAPWKSQKRGF